MGDDQQSRFSGFLAIEQQGDDLFTRRAIEIAGWFVGEDDRRPRSHRPCNRYPLLLAAGKLGRIMTEPIAKADGGQFLCCNLERLVLAIQFQRHRDIFQRCHRREQVESLQNNTNPAAPGNRELILVHRTKIGTGNIHGAASCPLQTRQDRHQR